MNKPTTIEEVRKALIPLWESKAFELLVVFGSMAQGRLTQESDLDLGYIAAGQIEDLDITNDVIRLTHWNDVDTVNLRRADPLLMMQVASHGIVLFSKNEEVFAEFQSLAFRRFVDTKKLRDATSKVLDRFEQERKKS